MRQLVHELLHQADQFEGRLACGAHIGSGTEIIARRRQTQDPYPRIIAAKVNQLDEAVDHSGIHHVRDIWAIEGGHNGATIIDCRRYRTAIAHRSSSWSHFWFLGGGSPRDARRPARPKPRLPAPSGGQSAD